MTDLSPERLAALVAKYHEVAKVHYETQNGVADVIEALAARVAELEAREVAVTRLMDATRSLLRQTEAAEEFAQEIGAPVAAFREARAALRELGVKE